MSKKRLAAGTALVLLLASVAAVASVTATAKPTKASASVKVGFITSGAASEEAGTPFDTAKPGNSSAGHRYGTDLTPGDKRALLEYLKTL